MSFLEGIDPQQADALLKSAETVRLHPEQVLFSEFDLANGFYRVINGKLRVTKNHLGKEVEVGKLGAGEVFGEVGLLRGIGLRSATVQAIEATELQEFNSRVLLAFEKSNVRAALKLYQNLIQILADRLAWVETPGHPKTDPRPTLEQRFEYDHYAVLDEEAYTRGLQAAQALVPDDLFARFFRIDKRIMPGAALCKAGEHSDGLYVVTSGKLSVEVPHMDEEPREIEAPVILGEIGFLTNKLRSATIRALTEVVYTKVIHEDLLRLEKKEPEEALRFYKSAAMMIVLTLLRRESSR